MGLKMLIKFFVLGVVVFILSFGLNYLFLILDEKNIVKIGSFVHIGTVGILVFLPLIVFHKIRVSPQFCVLSLVIFGIISYFPLIYLRYNSLILLEIFVYVSFIIYISCKKLGRKGVR
jgi:predicted membrane channel-forming protein YqfA (hemolysin III family)